MSELTAQCVAEAKFRLALEACPNGMVMFDERGIIADVNTEIEEKFGYGRDELIGRPVDMLVPERLSNAEAHRSAAFDLQAQTRRIGAGRDLFGLRKDGSEFPVEIGLSHIPNGEGVLILGVVLDVSDRKRSERLTSEFVATVSHELRTPLTSISGSLGLLMGMWAGQMPPAASRLLDIAHRNSQRLVRLVNDILDIEKLESGQVVFNLTRVDVGALLAQAIENNRGYAHAYGIRIRLAADSIEAEVNADPDRLGQVVTNLLSNAIKFSPPDGEVLVSVTRQDGLVRISVRDHGSGVPPAFRLHIFEKFAQADASDSREKGGTGLGLSIVKQIIERLGGKVGFDDAPEGGTIFYVELPAWVGASAWDIDRKSEASPHRLLIGEIPLERDHPDRVAVGQHRERA